MNWVGDYIYIYTYILETNQSSFGRTKMKQIIIAVIIIIIIVIITLLDHRIDWTKLRGANCQ